MVLFQGLFAYWPSSTPSGMPSEDLKSEAFAALEEARRLIDEADSLLGSDGPIRRRGSEESVFGLYDRLRQRLDEIDARGVDGLLERISTAVARLGALSDQIDRVRDRRARLAGI